MPRFSDIDHGREFDWGRTSADYGKYRDIYPETFYQKIYDLGLCLEGQDVLDLGTGTGVLPRGMYHSGARFTGTDVSENQIAEARRLSGLSQMAIDYAVSPAETLDFPNDSFDVITACQCYMYFDKARLLPNAARMLRPHGKLAVIFFAWLPDESEIARQSEALVLQYNPSWTGAGMRRSLLRLPEWEGEYFTLEVTVGYDLDVWFTRESWNGRIKASRGIGAALSAEQAAGFEREHMELLRQIAPERFRIPHYEQILLLQVNKPPVSR